MHEMSSIFYLHSCFSRATCVLICIIRVPSERGVYHIGGPEAVPADRGDGDGGH